MMFLDMELGGRRVGAVPCGIGAVLGVDFFYSAPVGMEMFNLFDFTSKASYIYRYWIASRTQT